MELAVVKGNLWATVKNKPLTGKKILAIEPVDKFGNKTGGILYALDSIGVGIGETVVFVRGYEASHCYLPEVVVTDATIIAKANEVECENS
jgi:ethanolamine utilization protein EutN